MIMSYLLIPERLAYIKKNKNHQYCHGCGKNGAQHSLVGMSIAPTFLENNMDIPGNTQETKNT